MHLFKNQNGDIYAYSDEDFINLARQKYPLRKISDEEIENDFTNEELHTKGRSIITDDYGYTPFSYTPEELAAQQEQEVKQQQLNHAQALLNQSIKLESGVYQRRMSTDEKSEFEAWQDDLLAFIDGDSETLPQTPGFIQELL